MEDGADDAVGDEASCAGSLVRLLMCLAAASWPGLCRQPPGSELSSFRVPACGKSACPSSCGTF